ARERDVGRREDARLRVVRVRVLDQREVTYATCIDDVHLILDRPRLAAEAYPEVRVPVVGVRRNEEDLGPLRDGHPRELRELDVVADEDGDLAEVGVEDLDVL